MIELAGVVKRYPGGSEDVYAVDGVDLAVQPGEMLALLGPSGSGKTTLLLLIAALLHPDSGSVHFNGRNLATFSENEVSDYLARDVGFIYQHFHLLPRVSAIENASIKLVLGGLGMREAQAMALPWLERVGLESRLDRAPHELSGGERQRVAIARALAGEPKLILADEPTGNLDSVRSKEVIELLRSIAHERNAAVVLVTHDIEAAAIADRTCSLRDGKVIDDRPGSDTDQLPASPRAPAAPA